MGDRQFVLMGLPADMPLLYLHDILCRNDLGSTTVEPIPTNRQRNPATYEDTDIPIPNSWFTQAFVDAMCSGDGPEVAAFDFEEKVRQRLISGERLFLTEGQTATPTNNISEGDHKMQFTTQLVSDIEQIPSRQPDQDERVSVLVLRKPGSTPDADESTSAAFLPALGAFIEDLGFDLDLSYIATDGIDVDVNPGGGGMATIRELIEGVTGSPEASEPTDLGAGQEPDNQTPDGAGVEPEGEVNPSEEPDTAVSSEPATGDPAPSEGGFQPPTDEEAGITGDV